MKSRKEMIYCKISLRERWVLVLQTRLVMEIHLELLDQSQYEWDMDAMNEFKLWKYDCYSYFRGECYILNI